MSVRVWLGLVLGGASAVVLTPAVEVRAEVESTEPVMIKDINPSSSGSSSPAEFRALGDLVLFIAFDPQHGRELWVIDGDETRLVTDIFPGTESAISPSGAYLIPVGDTAFLRADDGSNGSELWMSDGTAAGTVMVKDINPSGDSDLWNLFAVGDTVYFSADDGSNGRELWVSDGTAAGTVMVKDINPSGDSDPWNLFAVGDTVFFRADDGSNGSELWVSDGTAAGTVMVKDINPSGNSYPEFFTAVGDTVYFGADDGSNSQELWMSDGTAAGTVMVKDINPSGFSNPFSLTAVGGTVYFSADDGSNGRELWVSDGTAAGTVMVKDINPSGASDPRNLFAVGDIVYFSADDGSNGRELWVSDGTAAGTVMVKDINPSGNSYPEFFTAVGDTVYFGADDGSNGLELWMSDGTAAGTVMVKDINPSGDGNPLYMTAVGGTVYFSADDGSNGQELWGMNPGYLAGAFVPLTPSRILDTRGSDPVGELDGSGDAYVLQVTGVGGVPSSGVTAVALNVTVVDGQANDFGGYVTVFPCGTRPDASNLNFVSGQTVPNSVIAPLSADGEVCLYVYGVADVLVDVSGYFVSGFVPLTPDRILDTRGSDPVGELDGSGDAYTLQVTGVGGVPASATAVALNVTVVDGEANDFGGFVTVFPCGTRPDASNLNFVGGQTVPNSVIAPLSSSGTVCFYVYGVADLLVDVSGYVTSGFTPQVPDRILDTRGSDPVGELDGSGDAYVLQVTGGDVPASATAVALNVTVVDGQANDFGGFVTVFPCGTRPEASNLNFVGGQTVPNSVIAPLSSSGTVCLYVYGQADLLVDVSGHL